MNPYRFVRPFTRGSRRPSACVCRMALLGTLLPVAVQAQILNPGPVQQALEPVTRGVEELGRRVERDIVRPVQDQVQEQALDVSGRPVTGAVTPVLGALLDLPEQLPVVNRQGEAVFLDVVVEDGWRAVERQWLLTLEPGELDVLQQAPIEILEQSEFEGLALTLLRFRVPQQLDSREALREILPVEIVERLDRNHIYSPQARLGSGIPAPQQSLCEADIRIGMVDTAIQREHPAFVTSRIVERSFLGDAFAEPDAHGTAVAGLLVGAADGWPARLPGATLYNASVFYARSQYAQGATMMHLLRGLDWLMQEDVSVINMSLAGPANKLLASVLAGINGRGKVVVAAAGNEGPAAPPLYPAAYEGVIAATAVDQEAAIYRWANRGDHVDFAAHGVSVLTARSGGEFGRESGTSMAAPIVSAYVACELAANGGQPDEAIKRLMDQVVDLGEPGRDPVFGYGLLGGE